MFKIIFFLISLFSSLSSYSGSLEDYLNLVSSQCETTNKLIIKKSLIELIQGHDCKAAFTSLLLRDCPQLSCKILNSYLNSLNSSQSGAVVGK